MFTLLETKTAIDSILKAQALPRDLHDQLRYGLERLYVGAAVAEYIETRIAAAEAAETPAVETPVVEAPAAE
jgi:hypothetical protein